MTRTLTGRLLSRSRQKCMQHMPGPFLWNDTPATTNVHNAAIYSTHNITLATLETRGVKAQHACGARVSEQHSKSATPLGSNGSCCSARPLRRSATGGGLALAMAHAPHPTALCLRPHSLPGFGRSDASWMSSSLPRGRRLHSSSSASPSDVATHRPKSRLAISVATATPASQAVGKPPMDLWPTCACQRPLRPG